MELLKKKYARDLYLPELQTLVDYGDVVNVRGRKTLEILNFASVIEEPWHHCILIPSRRWNPWLALSEALWILAGRNDVAALKPYNQHISDYSDDGVTLYGAYGSRIYDQIDEVIGRLQKDPSDRRALLDIWDSDKRPDKWNTDLIVDSKDPPCNNMVYFKLRDNKLHMTVICRSNDIHFGLFAVNIPTFGILQEYIAARLGVDIGTQTHLSNSLHVYTDDKRAVEITDRMLYIEKEDLSKYPEHSLAFGFNDLHKIRTHAEFATLCSSVLDADYEIRSGLQYPLFLAFAGRFLRQYRRKEFPINDTFPEFTDWTMAGQIFADKVWK